MERRGRIPVARFRTQEGKTRSRSRVRDPDYNEQDPETNLFTLLEDNIALKKENKALKVEIEDGLDALVKEFKSGRVTLRRNRRKTRTNEALQEMFEVLESSQKQNRNSKICINMQL